MSIIHREENEYWIYYRRNDKEILDPHKCGKWMYFFKHNFDKADRLCKKAVSYDICCSAKHSNKEEGVCCFYLNIDDIERHKKVLKFFLDNRLIRRTKDGHLQNIPFKLDEQTLAGEYGKDFHAKLRLEKLVNLETGQFLDLSNITIEY